MFSIQLSGPPPKEILRCDTSWVRGVNKESFRTNIQKALPSFLAKNKPSSLTSTEGIEQAARNLKELIHKTAEDSAPKNQKAAKPRSSWWTEDIEKLYINKQKARKNLKDNPVNENLAELKSISKQLKSATTKARRAHFKKLCEKMEKPWQLYNLLSKKCKRDAAIILSDQNATQSFTTLT
jgi:RecG-like helicase